jgi:hypothetical protein
MIVSSLIEGFNQFISRLYYRQWAAWEILTIAVVALAVLLWIISRLHARKLRKVYEGHFREDSPIIGVNLEARKRGRHLIGNLKKGRLASIHKHQKRQQAKTKGPSEKLHEEIKQLQYEIIKRKQAEVRLEHQVAELTSDNEKLQHELDEIRQAENQIAEKPAVDNLLEPEVSQTEQAEQAEQVEQAPEQQVKAEPAVEVPIKRKTAKRIKAYEKSHRIVDGIKQKLCRKCKEWKPEDEFHKNSSSTDGLAGACKKCKTNASREYRKRRKAAHG